MLNAAAFSSRLIDRADRTSSGVIYLVLALLVIAGKSVSIWSYYTSKYLYQDDAIFLGAAYFGIHIHSPQTQSLYYGLIDLVTELGGLTALKLMLIVMPILTCLLMYRILRSFTQHVLVAAALSLFLTLFPVSPEQSYFFTGAHPTAGVTLFMLVAGCYLMLLRQQEALSALRSALVFVACAVGFFAIIRTSPAFTLIPLLLVPMATFALWRDRRHLTPAHALYVIVPICFGAILLPGLGNYHYAALEGWTEVSVSRSLTNLLEGLAYIFQIPFSKTPVIGFICLIALAVIIGCLAKLSYDHLKQAGNRFSIEANVFWPFAVFLFLAAALVFGPSSITTNFLDRYVLAPFQIAGLLVSIWGVMLIEQFGTAQTVFKKISIFALCILAGASLIHASTLNTQKLSPYLGTHQKLVALLEERSWGAEDQILILLPQGEIESTGGYNHWSTWYLRVLTSTPGVIGLVGHNNHAGALQANGLYIDTYADHSPAFWSVKNGVSRRAQMLGLTRERPTYVYAPKDGALTLMPLQVQGNGYKKIIQPGQSFQDQPPLGVLDGVCGEKSEVDALVVSLNEPGRLETNGPYRNLIDTPFIADGQTAEMINIAADPSHAASIYIELTGDPTEGAQPFTRTLPQMPVLAPGFGIYLHANGYHILERDGEKQNFIAPLRNGQPISVTIKDCAPGPSQNALYVNGQFQGLFSDDVIYGQWRLGAGFEDRYWTGELGQLQISAPER